MTKKRITMTKQEWLDVIHYSRGNVNDWYANTLADQISDQADLEKDVLAGKIQ